MLKIGNYHFNSNIIQGPLAGISLAPFRLLAASYGSLAYVCTEMISAKTILYQACLHDRYLHNLDNKIPVCYQLSGHDENELGDAAAFLKNNGANLIDLNCGCPVKKIRKKGAGSALLQNPDQLYKILSVMRENVDIPIGIKIRLHKAGDPPQNEIISVIKTCKIDFLVVHGRHFTEHYETPCRFEEISMYVNQLEIPVIGNGDVCCVQSYRKMLSSGCAGVMISRAGVGQPWIYKKILNEHQGKDFHIPSWRERRDHFIKHISLLHRYFPSEARLIEKARGLGKYYVRDASFRNDFVAALNQCHSLNDLKLICDKYF